MFGLVTKNMLKNKIFWWDFKQCLKSKLFGNRTVIECLELTLVKISDSSVLVKMIVIDLY